ncbi:5-oxoprolinase subunit PxpA [Atopomonas sediminilitoris]|uniref:5-oxoprolinase subunit PxpA n=1 Tax=Atopomonas sediminilitoris TaxID=2919919 RepID=UPI001F4E2DAF|nr:5-oxoprolinase subunit PxpA [Atopomonas sediminilitoris]MCJ8168497.1 LamB/YcsF family protein [Atopomonas sediminilitoris]
MGILLNCDMGESFGAWRMGEDELVMPLVDQANIACGFHAADPLTMQRTVKLALDNEVSIGAHPAYPDLVGFGRRAMAVEPEEVEALLLYQIGALDGLCRAEGSQVDYVKPHGALYNAIASDASLLRAALSACARYREGLPLMVLARVDNSASQRIAEQLGVPLLFEAFADRGYAADGSLLVRGTPGAVHGEDELILAQALAFARGEPVSLAGGGTLTLQADSLCVHGDHAHSRAVLRRLRAALDAL